MWIRRASVSLTVLDSLFALSPDFSIMFTRSVSLMPVPFTTLIFLASATVSVEIFTPATRISLRSAGPFTIRGRRFCAQSTAVISQFLSSSILGCKLKANSRTQSCPFPHCSVSCSPPVYSSIAVLSSCLEPTASSSGSRSSTYPFPSQGPSSPSAACSLSAKVWFPD
jgi:hypothetical protein